MTNKLSKVYVALVLGYLAAHIVFSLPNILSRHVTRISTVNWLRPARHAENPAPGPHRSYFKKRGLSSTALGYSLLRKGLLLTGEEVRLSKFYPWLLAGIAALFLFALASRIAGPAAGLFAGVLFLHMPVLMDTLSGIPNTFTWPLLAAFLLYQHKQNSRATLIVVALAGLFYPPLAFQLAILFIAGLIQRSPKTGRPHLSLNDRRLWVLAALMVAIFFAVVPWALIGGNENAPKRISYESRIARDAALNCDKEPPSDADALSWETAYESVTSYCARELAFSSTQPFQVWGASVAGPFLPTWTFRWGMTSLMLLVLGIAGWMGPGGLSALGLIWRTVFCSVGLYLVALLVAFNLFYPERYIAFVLPVASVLLVSVLAARALDHLPGALKRIAPLLLVALYLGGWGTGIHTGLGPEEDFREAAKTLDFLAGTHEDSVTATPLLLGDALELFSDREAFLFCQEVNSISHVVGGAEYQGIYRRLRGFYAALYAPSGKEVLSFMNKYKLDYLMAPVQFYDKTFLSDGVNMCPHEVAIARKAFQENEVHFLANPPLEILAFADADYPVISLQKLRAHLDAQ